MSLYDFMYMNGSVIRHLHKEITDLSGEDDDDGSEDAPRLLNDHRDDIIYMSW